MALTWRKPAHPEDDSEDAREKHREQSGLDFIVLIRRLLGRPGNDQRRSRFIDQNAVHFVNNGVIELALNIIIQRKFPMLSRR